MISNILCSALLAATIFSQNTKASTFDASASNNLALYWGQNSAGDQESLATYCEKGDANIIILSFLYEYPSTVGLNFADACSSTFADGVLDCTTIAADILTCQDLGVKILLSLGGSSGSYGFTGDDEATAFATTLWDYFGEGSGTDRPFGDSIVDGFDFDIENNSDTGYTALVTELRSIFASNGTKDYYISAAPQCPYPDAGVGDLLLNADVDFAFVQFYNNYCNLGTTNFNWDTWKDFAENDSYNKDIKIFLGLPGSSGAASSGYQSNLSVVEDAVATMSESSSFGGIMLWDASQAYDNTVDDESYAADMKSIVDNYESTTTSSSSATSTASTTSKTSSSSSTKQSTTTSSSTSTSSTKQSTTTSSSSSTSSTKQSTTTSSSSTSTISKSSTTSSESTYTPTESKTTTTLAPSTTTTSSAAASTTSTVESSSRSTTTLAPSTTTTSINWNEPLTTETITLPNGVVTTSHVWWLPETTTINTWEQPLTTETITLSNGAVTTTHIWWLPESTTTTASSIATSTASSASTTVAPTTATSQTSSSTSTQTASSTVTDAALASAIALNKEYESGLSSTCTNGDMACDAEGNFALCGADGKWSIFECSTGTTCFAYTQSDEVFIGCNWSYEKSTFE
ncbi:glycoside hydrolase [Hanseniaspora valbyensis NRRL Y-1626]|uniref:chitinase n=1 Tax=Hanseniaspora valbyensis NRRL Y-1626 TaxID=766949 RepID=A0A1B7TEX8_9ASCO|nr:glycoside hydrolase [Hanseniaspora valbyensis NRRL Y-1626]